MLEDPNACMVVAGNGVQLRAELFHPFRELLLKDFRMNSM